MEVGTRPPPRPIADDPPAPAVAPERSGEPEPDFARVLRTLGARIDEGSRLMARVEHGGALDARQLIALQSGIYRYTESVELAAKLVDRAGNAIRTTLQSQ